MLKNEDLKRLSKTTTLLSTLKQYFIDLDDNNLYDQTGITLKDIQEGIQTLNHIHTTETIKHVKASEKSNAWNKAHPEQHRKHNRESGRKRYNEKKGGVK